jgi:delta(3,5)-delta(2,4)-dienoyl-CoA isomerase
LGNNYKQYRSFHRKQFSDISSRVFDTREALLDAAISIASVIARKSPVAVQGSKINLNYARDHSTDDSFNFIVN